MRGTLGKQPKAVLQHMVVTHQQRMVMPQRPKFREEICTYVRDQIRNGFWSSGEKIVEAQLAEQFKVSIIRVRESVEQLISEGWVHRIPNRGLFVREFGQAALQDIYRVREMFEGEAAAVVAKTCKKVQIDELSHLNTLIDQAVRDGDYESTRDADAHFHRLLVHFAGNRKLEELFESVLLLTHGALFSVNSDLPYESSEIQDLLRLAGHKQICTALRKHDANLAGQLAREHIRAAYKSCLIMVEYRQQATAEGND